MSPDHEVNDRKNKGAKKKKKKKKGSLTSTQRDKGEKRDAMHYSDPLPLPLCAALKQKINSAKKIECKKN